MKEDGITPISDIFHLDNYQIWINNEDIDECNIESGGGLWKGISVNLNFYHDDGRKQNFFRWE